jgi:hypothetical protein
MPSDQDPQPQPPAIKKQKTTAGGSENQKKKKTPSVKAVDPAIIEQRRDAVQSRVLRLESKLAKDRALLAKYSVQTGEGNKASEEGEGSDDA